jgi:hypothetical protein
MTERSWVTARGVGPDDATPSNAHTGPHSTTFAKRSPSRLTSSASLRTSPFHLRFIHAALSSAPTPRPPRSRPCVAAHNLVQRERPARYLIARLARAAPAFAVRAVRAVARAAQASLYPAAPRAASRTGLWARSRLARFASMRGGAATEDSPDAAPICGFSARWDDAEVRDCQSARLVS